MVFRIAVGRCTCKKPYGDEIQRVACEALEARVAAWREQLPQGSSSPAGTFTERETVDGQRITLSTIKEDRGSGDTLMVFTALAHTWSRPTFLSFGAVGRVYAEGFMVAGDGAVQPAPRELVDRYT